MNVDDIKHVGVIGAGLMGHGIALEFALAGYSVSLSDVSDQRLAEAKRNVAESLGTLEKLGLASREQTAQAPERIVMTTSLEQAVAPADFVIEAVTENLPLKKEIFGRLDRFSPERAILASNSSSFMPSEVAPATPRAERVLVAHYFNPPHLLPLVEVVRGPDTSDEAVAVTRDLLQKVGKRPVVLQKEAPGFVVNRLQAALMREAISIVDKGIASAEDVDLATRSSFGRRLAAAGPFEVFDAAGWDTIVAAMTGLLADIESSTEVPSRVRDMVERGDLGVKSGRGFYEWPPAASDALRSRIAEALVAIDRLPSSS